MSHMLWLKVPKLVRDSQFLFILLVLISLFQFMPSVLFLLPGSVSPLCGSLSFTSRKRHDFVLAFLITSMEISWFSWELFLSELSNTMSTAIFLLHFWQALNVLSRKFWKLPGRMIICQRMMEAACPWINQLAKLLKPPESLMQEVFPDYLLYLLVPVSTTYSWLLANIMTESFHCFQKCDKISGDRFSMIVLLEILVVDYYNVHTYHWRW